jgi:hypothetical protein
MLPLVPSAAMERAIVVVSRVFGVYLWQHRHAEDDGWFERRMDLMQRITVPALSRVQAPFVWVWQAHATKMDLVAEQLQRLDLHGIDVRLVNQSERTRHDIWPDSAKLITFRIDTDDAWLPAAIDGVAGRSLDDRTLLNFRRGVALDWNSGEMRHLNFSYQGPFLAVTQDREMMLDVGGAHREAQKGRTVEHVDAISWVQVVHGGNARNRLPREPTKNAYEREGPEAAGAPVRRELREQIVVASGIRLDEGSPSEPQDTAPDADRRPLLRRLGQLLAR